MDRNIVRQIVEEATTAPSGGNAQPWRFVFEGGVLRLHLDLERSSSTLDYDRSASVMALGAATESAVLAAHARGLDVKVDFTLAGEEIPTGADPEIARLLFSPRSEAAAGVEPHDFDALAAHLKTRDTNRRQAKRKPIPGAELEALRAAAEAIPGARLQLLTEPAALDGIGKILGEGDRLRMLDSKLHVEMMGELRFSKQEAEETKDGIDVLTLEVPPPVQAFVRQLRKPGFVRFMNFVTFGKALEMPTVQSIASASAVGLISMRGASRRDFFDGGRAMQRTWLTAASRGLAFQPTSVLPYLFARVLRGGGAGLPADHVPQYRALRERYIKLFDVKDTEAEILLFRLAYAPPVTIRALRRPVDEVLTIRD